MKKIDTYKQDGVNVSTGDFLSALAKGIAQKTYKASPFVKVHANDNYFRAVVTWTLMQIEMLKDVQFFKGADGIGTKVGFHQAAKTYQYASRDLIAMLETDCSRYGGLPLILTNILSVSSVGSHTDDATSDERNIFLANQMLLKGLAKTAKETGLVLLGGEIAEKGQYVGSELPLVKNLRFDWEGELTGIMHPDKMITGETLQPGQVVIALGENGFRSNGISSVRKAFAKHYAPNVGMEWWNNPEAVEDIKLAATPSVLYGKFLSTLNGWFSHNLTPMVKIHAIAHISGGGIESKFGHDILFRKGLSAELNHLFTPPMIMRQCKQWRGMSDHECYSTWNGGQGVLLVVDNDQSSIAKVLGTAKSFGIEAKVAGFIAKWKRPRIEILSGFSVKNTTLKFYGK